MTRLEEGFLLLASHLGDPERKPLTIAQFRILARQIAGAKRVFDHRDLQISDLTALGYGKEPAMRILTLMEEQERLSHYLARGAALGCYPLTRISPGYPQRLRTRLGNDAPLCLWYKGDPSLLSDRFVGIVGSRELLPQNAHFAQIAGTQAAIQGYTVVSGNAKGADRIAQNACLSHGGHVISILADSLVHKPVSSGILYLSEDSYDLPFSAYRALSRNRLIHSLGDFTLVAQSALETGGTWDGSVKNLRNHWTALYCFRDGTPAALSLEDQGAILIGEDMLDDFSLLPCQPKSLFDMV